MHESHIRNLITLDANLDRAIRNQEHVLIGGGIFSPDELQSLRLAVVTTLIANRRNGSEEVQALIAAALKD